MMTSDSDLDLTLPAFVRVLMPTNQVEEMKLETYLAGVVAAEMGPVAHLESLKAQAVASRTYVAMKQRHPEHQADVCTLAHCQKWKRVDPVSAPDVFRALTETWGMVLIYENQLIDAFFFDHCDGHTRSAEDLHMPPVDYLRGVDCACGLLTLKGHGVGMCKRGAMRMALGGASFVQILCHYYRDVVVTRVVVENAIVPQLEEVAPPRAPEVKKIRPRKIVQEKTPPARKTTLAKAVREPAKPTPPAREPIKPPTPLRESIRLPGPVRDLLKSPARPSVSPETIVTPPPSNRGLLKKMALRLLPHREASSKPVAPLSESAPVELPSPSMVAAITESKPLIVRDDATHVPVVLSPEPKPVEPSAPSMVESIELSVEQEDAMLASADAVAESYAPTESESAEQVSTELWEATLPSEPTIVESTVVPTQEPVAPRMVTVIEQGIPVLEEEITVKPKRDFNVDYLPGERMIAGCLARADVEIVIEDVRGNRLTVVSGTAPHYGAGGFEVALEVDGTYHVTIDGQIIQADVRGETVFISAG